MSALFGKLSAGCYVALAQQQLLFGNSFLFKSLLALHLEKKNSGVCIPAEAAGGNFFLRIAAFPGAEIVVCLPDSTSVHTLLEHTLYLFLSFSWFMKFIYLF